MDHEIYVTLTYVYFEVTLRVTWNLYPRYHVSPSSSLVLKGIGSQTCTRIFKERSWREEHFATNFMIIDKFIRKL